MKSVDSLQILLLIQEEMDDQTLKYDVFLY